MTFGPVFVSWLQVHTNYLEQQIKAGLALEGGEKLHIKWGFGWKMPLNHTIESKWVREWVHLLSSKGMLSYPRYTNHRGGMWSSLAPVNITEFRSLNFTHNKRSLWNRPKANNESALKACKKDIYYSNSNVFYLTARVLSLIDVLWLPRWQVPCQRLPPLFMRIKIIPVR